MNPQFVEVSVHSGLAVRLMAEGYPRRETVLGRNQQAPSISGSGSNQRPGFSLCLMFHPGLSLLIDATHIQGGTPTIHLLHPLSHTLIQPLLKLPTCGHMRLWGSRDTSHKSRGLCYKFSAPVPEHISYWQIGGLIIQYTLVSPGP